MRSFLACLGVVLVASVADAGTILHGELQRRLMHFRGKVYQDGVEYDNIHAIATWANHTNVLYEATVEEGVVTALEMTPTTESQQRGAAVVTLGSEQLVLMASLAEFGGSTTIWFDGGNTSPFLPLPSVFDEPLTWGPLTDNGDGTFTVAEVDGPWFNPDFTIYDQAIDGVQYEIVIHRVGWFRTDSITLIPEPPTWITAALVLLVGLPMYRAWCRYGRRCEPGRRGAFSTTEA